ncbi:hypothetical protein [Stackebrandtia nassauensis]|uniref:Uncharacterized protein n=1 Tax=Stackebrandtia nassauensis (strain DSM 44728 / CIP 108903 / NRRL B-16338 / NBRC 102104 / LLR-40K-21) TaxID=446470 RepID=D3Q371_STANL|nr:hypothetical protein [Stackebrandtia nassauensis]ADD40041.1 hypothetical protein Snas_0323 [Stackebrandtia nassauensis DSM 44728]
MERETHQTWLVWGDTEIEAFLDGYWLTPVGVDDPDLLSMIRDRDPEWEPPNDDVENLDDLNNSCALVVSTITEKEIVERTAEVRKSLRGYIRIK